jgi:hypothetical protein
VARARNAARQAADQRYDNAYLFGAICPARGVGGRWRCPMPDTDMMQLHLDEISRNVTDGAHARQGRMAYDEQARRARQHNTDLPAFPCARIEPGRDVWQYLRQNWLSNTVFENYDAIIDAACAAWRNLAAKPETITPIRMRDWPHVGQPL